MALHVGDMGRVTGVTLEFIEHAQQDGQDGIPVGGMVRLGLDIERNHIGGERHGPLDVPVKQGIFDLGLKEVGGALHIAIGVQFTVSHEIRKHLEEVGLAGAEKP